MALPFVAYNDFKSHTGGNRAMYRWARKHLRLASRTAEPSVDDGGDPEGAGRRADADDRAAARRDQRAADEDSAATAVDRSGRGDREPPVHQRWSATGSGADPSDPSLEHSAEDTRLIDQAQGMVMEAHDLTAAEALLTLYQRASKDGSDLRTAALRIIDEHTAP